MIWYDRMPGMSEVTGANANKVENTGQSEKAASSGTFGKFKIRTGTGNKTFKNAEVMSAKDKLNGKAARNVTSENPEKADNDEQPHKE